MALLNQEASYIAKEYFKRTNRRATKGTMGMSINQAKSLREAGFTVDEILQGIDYCVENPPPKGFQSLGWLAYDLENILIKIKAKKAKQQLSMQNVTRGDTDEYAKTNDRYKRNNSESRGREGYDFSLFD